MPVSTVFSALLAAAASALAAASADSIACMMHIQSSKNVSPACWKLQEILLRMLQLPAACHLSKLALGSTIDEQGLHSIYDRLQPSTATEAAYQVVGLSCRQSGRAGCGGVGLAGMLGCHQCTLLCRRSCCGGLQCTPTPSEYNLHSPSMTYVAQNSCE